MTCLTMAFVHSQSCEGVKSELGLFRVRPTQSSIDAVQWVEHRSMASLHSGGPIEFLLPGSGDAFLHMANTYLFVRAKVTKGDGTNLDPNEAVDPVNNWLHSLFSQLDVYQNDSLVTSSTNTYRAYIETAFSYGTEARDATDESTVVKKTPPVTWKRSTTRTQGGGI